MAVHLILDRVGKKIETAMRPWISCLTTCFGPFGLKGAIASLPAVGLDSIELPIGSDEFAGHLGNPADVTTASTECDLREIENLLHEHQTRVASCLITTGNPLDSAIVAQLKRKLDLAKRFGVKLVVGDGGAAGDAAELQILYRHLSELGDYAASLEIVYCCDTAPGICLNHRSMLKAMLELNHRHLRLSFNPGNLLLYNNRPTVETALAKVCHLVQHVRLNDSQGEYGELYSPPLGYGGAVDYLRILQIMRDRGFSGPYSITITGTAGEAALELTEYQQRLRQSLRTLRDCGFFNG